MGPRQRWTPAVVAQLAVVSTLLVAGVVTAVSLPGRPGRAAVDARALVAQAATRVTAVGSYASTFEVDVQGQGVSVRLRGSGLADTIRKLQSGSFEVPTAGTLTFRQVGQHGYFELPGGRTDALGHHWIGFATPAGSNAAGVLGSQDPLAMLRALSGSQQVTNHGTERVAGIPTTRYSVALDVSRLIAAAQSAGSTTTIPAGLAGHIHDSRADIWLDQQNLPRRFRISMTADSVKISFQFQFSDYGKAVDVSAPPAGDVTEAATPQQAAQALQGSLRG